MPRGDKHQIMKYPVVLPSKDALDLFNGIVAPMLDQIASNRIENTRLTSLRDTLLPRLISGELDVSGAYRILDVDTTSGGMKFAGEVKNVEIDTVSGDVTMNCSETPDELSLDSTSGDLELLLPERRSFEASYDTVSGDFHNEFGGIQFRGDEMYFEGTEGGNPAELEFDTVSGDVRIEKAAG